MNRPEPCIQPEGPELFTARVVAADGRELLLEGEGGPLPARRAASCLLAPAPGDLALASRLASGRCYLLAVLESLEPGPARLEVPGDLDISAPGGRVGISARDGLELATPAAATATVGELELEAGRGRLRFGGLDLLADSLRAGARRARLTLEVLEQVCGRVMQCIRSRFTQVEEMDQLEATTITRRAEDLITMESRYALIAADEDVKVDGAMIHLG